MLRLSRSENPRYWCFRSALLSPLWLYAYFFQTQNGDEQNPESDQRGKECCHHKSADPQRFGKQADKRIVFVKEPGVSGEEQVVESFKQSVKSRINADPDQDSPIADAIMDRIINNSYIVSVEGRISMRERHGLKADKAGKAGEQA